MRIGFGKCTFLGLLLLIFFIAPLSAAAESLSDLDMTTFQVQKEQYDVKSRASPFASGVSTADDLTIESLQLTGIVYADEQNAYALISGYLVKMGDKIAGYRVDSIERDKVKLRRVDDIYVLALGGGI